MVESVNIDLFFQYHWFTLNNLTYYLFLNVLKTFGYATSKIMIYLIIQVKLHKDNWINALK